MQLTGILMRRDPAPFVVNLFLYYFERQWLFQTEKWDLRKARIFLCTLNNDEFENNCKETYPDAPELLKENEDPRKSSILDLLIKFHDRKFTSDLIDERYFFPFYINRLPYMDSNITSKTFCASISSEILHISGTTTDLIIMVARANLLLIWMKKER